MKLNCIVVDDSAIQRMTITKLVNESTNLNLVGDFANALEAKNAINNNSVDLIFLDIEMPLINGFDLLDGLKTKPQIVFIIFFNAINNIFNALVYFKGFPIVIKHS